MDYISFSRRFFVATGVPVTLPEKGTAYASLRREDEPLPDVRWDMWTDT